MKIYSMIPILTSLMLLSACGSSDSSDDEESSSSPPVTTTELEGTWISRDESPTREFEQIYIFSGNEYDYSSVNKIESGTFVTGASFTNDIGLEVTRITFNRELLNGELATDSQLETYYLDQGKLNFGNRSGDLRYATFYRE